MSDGSFYYDHGFKKDESSDDNGSGPHLRTQGPSSESKPTSVVAEDDIIISQDPLDSTTDTEGSSTTVAQAKKIDDVGEVIAGAKKDQWQKYRETISDEVDVASEPLSKSFPQPDYEKLASEGESKRVLALVAILRSQIPAKPKRAGRINTWVKTVNAVRGVASLVMESPDRVDSALNAAIRARVLTSESKALLDMMEQLPPSKIKEAATFQIGSGAYGIYNGERFSPPKVVYSIASKHRVPELTRQGFDNAQEAASALKTYLSETGTTGKQSKSAAKLDVYRDRYTGEAFVGWRSSAGVLRVEVFEDIKQARQAIAERRNELEIKLADMKRVPSMRETMNLTRVGPERRTGNVDAEEFRETFGFRGVQFGNYVEQGKRQKDLNEAYDGLMDLAELLNIPPRAISLNGKLALAFGARGRGKYAAHYEPGQVVINLTKNSGSGSLAHEWWHALDNYFGGANANGDHDFLTGRGARSRSVTGDLRQDVADAFSGVIKSIEATDLRDRSKKLDNLRTKPYWSTNVEMSARAFESYVKARLGEQNRSNDYLANIRSEEAWSNLSETASYPYPTDAEIASITAAYDELFSTLQYRETEDGIALFSLAESQTEGMKAEDVSKSLESLIKDLHESNTFNVVQSINDLPFSIRIQAKARLRNSKADKPVLRGINAGDKNYLIADGLRNEKEAVEIFLHEVVGHKAVLDMLGKDGDNIMERIAMSYGRKGLADLIDTYGVDYSTKEGRILLGKEKVAHMAERGEKPTLLKQLAAKVKSWLRNYFPSIKWSDNDVLSLISNARERVENRYMVKVDLDANSERSTQEDRVNLSIISDVKSKLDERLKPKAEETEFDKFYKSLGDKDRSLAERSKQFMRRQFAAGGLLPDNVFKEKIARDGVMNANELEISARLQVFRKAVKKAYKKEYDSLSPAQKAELNRQLTSTETNKRIPLNVRASIVELRSVINGLSKEYANVLDQEIAELKASGNTVDVAEKLSLLHTIRSNMGTYANRSYRAFDDPKWPKKVSSEVVERAEEYVKARYLAQGMSSKDATHLARRTVKTILEEGTAYQSMSSFIKESKLGAKDLSTLKHRKDIAPEIMALLGVYEDIEINFAKTVTKMSRLIGNHLFLKRVLEIGKQEGFLFTEDDKPLNRSVVRIAADGSEVLAPLNGLYTYPEIDQAFRDALSKGGSQEAWVNAWIRFNGMVKYGKTVISPTTAMRNIWSAFFFTMANGHFDMSHLQKSLSMSTQYFGGDYDKAKLEYLKKLQRLGVVHDNPHAGEMMDLLKDSQLEEMLFSKKPFSSLKKLTDFAQTFYQYGDDMWKIVGFENEKALLMKHKRMTEEEAEVAAAERIRNTYPTYSMVGKFPQWLRRLPLAGTFVSFPSEILRTSFHMLNYLRQDFKDSPEYAMRKVAGLALVSSLAFAAQGLSKAMMGLDDEEEEAVRDMAAPWQKNSSLMFLGRDDNGNVQYLDLSFLDPYNYFKRPINAILRDQSIDEMAVQSASEMLTPFFGEDITFGTLREIYTNKKETGGTVFNEQDSISNQTLDIVDHLRKGLQPGVANNIERMFKAVNGDVSASGKEYKVEDEIAALFGFRSSTVDPKTALYYQSFDFKQSKADASRVLKQVLRDPNEVSQSDLDDARDIMISSREQSYERMMRLVKSAKKSGMSNAEIRKVLKLSGISQKDVMSLMFGRIPKEDDYTKMAETIAERAAILYGADAGREVTRRANSL
jgi:hypothetical protein